MKEIHNFQIGSGPVYHQFFLLKNILHFIPLLPISPHSHNFLFQMEAYPASEIGEVLERISALQRCSSSLAAQRHDLAMLLQRLTAVEGTDDLADSADALHDRLDALELILRVQADRVSDFFCIGITLRSLRHGSINLTP